MGFGMFINMSVHGIISAEKLLKAHPEMTIKEAADRSGFADAYYFSRLYRQYRGRTPGEFRKKP